MNTTKKSAHPTRPVEIRLALQRTPPVNKTDLKTALYLAREVALVGEPEALANAIAERFGASDNAMALWTRTRALLRWQALDSTRESDRLMYEALLTESRLGCEIDPDWEMILEAKARIGAASKHPIDAAGHFTAGFAAAIDAAKRAAKCKALTSGLTVN